MNKTYKYIGLVLVAFALLSSCNDQFLKDKHSYDKFDEQIFASQTQTSWFIDNIYYDFFSGYRSPVQTLTGSYSDERTKMTEEIGGTISNWIHPNKDFMKASDAPNYYGDPISGSTKNQPYTRIKNCNILLEKIDDIGRDLDANFRNSAKGQAYYLRALQYFDLVRVHGGVPIVLKVQDPTPNNPSIQLPRSTSSECFAQIAADLDMAAELLKDTKWDGSSNYGRATQAAALALKSRVLLTAASPLFNKNWENSADENWKKALEAGLEAERVLSIAGYKLHGSSAKDWNDMFTNYDNKSCPEVINVQLLSNSNVSAINNSWENLIRPKSQTGGGGIPAPKEMIDLFPMADGSRPGATYDDKKFFMDRDPRFYRTFAFNGSKWAYTNNEDATVWFYKYFYLNKDGKEVSKYAQDNSLGSPAYVKKMSDIKAISERFGQSGTDIFEYRYAELILNIAECYAATGNTAKALDYLMQIRERVGIPAANSYGIGTLANKYDAIEACLYERRVELAYEGKRFWDIQRWMLYNDDTATGNSTCAKLGITPINGTTRTGHHWSVKALQPSDKEPLVNERKDIIIDPDASDFQAQLTKLSNFYDQYLHRIDPETPMDKEGKNPINIEFKQRYYIFGLKDNVLKQNPWLEQTAGWQDAYGSEGTFDYKN